MKMTSFSINGRAVSRLSINGREVSLRQEPVLCDALCFTAEQPGSTIKLTSRGNVPSVNLQTSTDGISWTPYAKETTLTLSNADDKVYFKAIGQNTRFSSGQDANNYFSLTGKIAASGNINSLLEEDEETARTMSLAGRQWCFSRLFDGQSALVEPPELPATEIDVGSYYALFADTSIRNPVSLPATKVYDNSYKYLFSSTQITRAPELPATTLGQKCYEGMFANDKIENTPSVLPATNVPYMAYYAMFDKCSKITQSPDILATSLASLSFYYMFRSCSSLNYVKVHFTSWTGYTSSWLQSVSSTGIFECPQELIDVTTTRGASTVPANWTMKRDTFGGLCFTAKEANSTVKMSANGSAPAVNLQTSTDGKSWTPYAVGDTITLANVDDKVYWKAVGTNTVMGSSLSNYNTFVMTGKIAASGNINSLLEEDEETARTMSLAGKNYCYCQMFSNCRSLTQAPELPATTLATECYLAMFAGCSSLTQAPELPATTLADGCYSGMFENCTSLTQAPALPATTLATECYSAMFNGCTSLIQAPALPATELTTDCYLGMFSDCLSLNYVNVAFTNWDPAGATDGWLPDNVGTFKCPWELITNTSTRDESTVPPNWTMVDKDTSPYISENLIAWYDGKMNNGIGQHSDTTIVWKNLGSEGQDYDATYMDDTVNWSEDSHNFVYSGGKCFLMPNSDILINHFDPVSGGYTVQVVCMPTYQTTYSGIVGNQHKNSTNPLLFGQWQGSSRLFFMGNGALEGNYIPLNQIHTYTLVADTSAKTLALYRDNEQLTQASAPFKMPTAGNDVQMAIGRGNVDAGQTNRNFQGKIYCVRFYDRALTKNEIYSNVDEDKNRFNF